MQIAVAGTGYVGLSLSVLLAQHNEVTAVDIVKEKVEKINNKKSPIVDKEIEEYLANHKLNLTATTDAEAAYRNAEFVISGSFHAIVFSILYRKPFLAYKGDADSRMKQVLSNSMFI